MLNIFGLVIFCFLSFFSFIWYCHRCGLLLWLPAKDTFEPLPNAFIVLFNKGHSVNVLWHIVLLLICVLTGSATSFWNRSFLKLFVWIMQCLLLKIPRMYVSNKFNYKTNMHNGILKIDRQGHQLGNHILSKCPWDQKRIEIIDLS